MGLSRWAALLLCLALAACSRPAPPAAAGEAAGAKASGSSLRTQPVVLKDRRARPGLEQQDDIRASISLLQTAEAGIDRRIEQWVGSLCPRQPETKLSPPNAQACLKLLMSECLALAEAGGRTPARCTYQAEVKLVYNDHFLLSLSHESYYDSGGAHGLPNIAYLNIDRRSGKTLALSDLIAVPTETLQGLLEKNLRAALNVPPQAALKASGFFEDRLPVTDNVAIDSQGLRFTYSAYQVAPYSMGLPNIRVPYAELAAHLAPDSPLARLWPP